MKTQLIENADGTVQVAIDHRHLDHLVGRLMEMADLMGDAEQRAAVKRTIKRESRDWLNNIYDEAGYKANTPPATE